MLNWDLLIDSRSQICRFVSNHWSSPMMCEQSSSVGSGGHLTAQRAARRARIILLCAEGRPIRQIAVEVGMDQHQVGLWRNRFLTDGLEGLDDQPRPGRPRRIGHDERMKLAAMATSERDATDPVAMWTYQELADALGADGIEISTSQIGRILNSMHIDITKVRGWLNRRDDPDFWERVRDEIVPFATSTANGTISSRSRC